LDQQLVNERLIVDSGGRFSNGLS